MKREREKEGENCYLFISIFLIWLCSSRYFFSLTLNVKMNTLSLKERERERERKREREKGCNTKGLVAIYLRRLEDNNDKKMIKQKRKKEKKEGGNDNDRTFRWKRNVHTQTFTKFQSSSITVSIVNVIDQLALEFLLYFNLEFFSNDSKNRRNFYWINSKD